MKFTIVVLLDKRRKPSGGWEPALPLILAAWDHSPGLVKIVRLQEHIEYASAHGVIEEVDSFLRALPESDWFHIGD